MKGRKREKDYKLPIKEEKKISAKNDWKSSPPMLPTVLLSC